MLWILILTALFAAAAWGFLGNTANRLNLGARLMRVMDIGATLANVITWYLLAICGGITIAATLMVLALALDWQGAAATILFLLGVAILAVTVPFWGAVTTIAKALNALDEEIKKVKIANLVPAEIAQVAGTDTIMQLAHTVERNLRKFLDPQAVTQILSLAPRVAFITLSSVVKALDSMFRFVVSMVIWVFVIGFGLLYLPEGFDLGYAITALTALGIIFFINGVMDWLTDKPFRQSIGMLRFAICIAIVAMVIPPLQHAWPEMFLGLNRYAEASREQAAIDAFGQDYDQHKLVVNKKTLAYKIDSKGSRRKIIIAADTKLWRVPEKSFELLTDGKRYFACWLEGMNLADAPDPDRGVYMVPGDALTARSKLASF